MYKPSSTLAFLSVMFVLMGGCSATPRHGGSMTLCESGGELTTLRHDISDFFIGRFVGDERKEIEKDILTLIEDTLPPRDTKEIEASIEGDDLVFRMTSERQVLLFHLLSQLREGLSLGMWVVADLFRFEPGSDNSIRQRLDSVAITPSGNPPDAQLVDPRKSLRFTEVDDLAKAAREQGVSVISMPPRYCRATQRCHYYVDVSPTIAELRNAEGLRVELPAEQPVISDGVQLAFTPIPRQKRGTIYVHCQASLIHHGSSSPVVKGDRIVFTSSGIKRSLDENVIVIDRTGLVLKGFMSSHVSSNTKGSETKSAPEPDPTLYLVVRVLEPGQRDPLAEMLYRRSIE